jgi:hypothetical protein
MEEMRMEQQKLQLRIENQRSLERVPLRDEEGTVSAAIAPKALQTGV